MIIVGKEEAALYCGTTSKTILKHERAGTFPTPINSNSYIKVWESEKLEKWAISWKARNSKHIRKKYIKTF